MQGDHVIALKDDGYVYAMGDDTYGQCGQADVDRSTGPPFTQKRIKYPTKVVITLPYVEKPRKGYQNRLWF